MDTKKNSTQSVKSQKKRKKKLPLRWFGVAALALVLIGVLLYFFRNDLLLLVPGYYQNYEYNNLTTKKNDLVDENSTLLDKNDELEAEVMSLDSTVEDYEKKIDTYSVIVANLEVIQDNLKQIVEYDNDFSKMRLPYSIDHYINLLGELDNIRLDQIDMSLRIAEARYELSVLNKTRAEFDGCLAGIDWTLSDQEISTAITVCNKNIDEMKAQVKSMEKDFDVDLGDTRNYFDLLGAEWNASAQYYQTLANGDYAGANEQDAIFAENKRIISELDVVDVLNEFFKEEIEPNVETFVELSEDESKAETDADDWYNNNVKR